MGAESAGRGPASSELRVEQGDSNAPAQQLPDDWCHCCSRLPGGRQTLWPWSGWLSVSITVNQESAGWSGLATGEIRLAARLPARGEGESDLHPPGQGPMVWRVLGPRLAPDRPFGSHAPRPCARCTEF